MEKVHDALNFNNPDEEFYKDARLELSCGPEFVIHCSHIYSDKNDSTNANNNNPMPVENETFVQLIEEPLKSCLEKNQRQNTPPINVTITDKTGDELNRNQGSNSSHFKSLHIISETFPENDIKVESKNKEKIFYTPVKENRVKRRICDSTKTLTQIKKRRCDNSNLPRLQIVPDSMVSKRYQGPFFYPHDHRNDTDPMWCKYKSKKLSPFEIVQNDWQNATLSYPHLDLSHMEGKRLHNISNRRECVHVRRIYENEISRLLQAKADILKEMSRPCRKFYQRNKFCRRRISKINEHLAVYENAKKELEYLLFNYHDKHFDAVFMGQCELEDILYEKEKIRTYEDFYGRPD